MPQAIIYSFCPKSFSTTQCLCTSGCPLLSFHPALSLILFPPSTVYRRVRSISAVIRVVSRCVVCVHASVSVCVYVCHTQRSFISSFISRSAPSSPGSRCLLSFFPYFHTLAHTCSCPTPLPLLCLPLCHSLSSLM